VRAAAFICRKERIEHKTEWDIASNLSGRKGENGGARLPASQTQIHLTQRRQGAKPREGAKFKRGSRNARRLLPTFVSYATKFSHAGSTNECFAGTWRAWIYRGITANLGTIGKTVVACHIFKGMPLLQTFVPYVTQVCHAAKMNSSREFSPIFETTVFTRQRLWRAWNKICNS
jgi:hypothetical protein